MGESGFGDWKVTGWGWESSGEVRSPAGGERSLQNWRHLFRSVVEKAECWKEAVSGDVTEGWRGLQGQGFSTQDRDDLAALG